MENEVCESCGRQIGLSEQAWVYNDNVVCQACYNRLKESNSHRYEPVSNNSGRPSKADFPPPCPAIAGTVPTKPDKVTTIAAMRIGSGVCSILAGIVFFWLVLPLVMIALGVAEIVSAINLLQTRPANPSWLKTIAILEIAAVLTFAGWVSVVVGVITLVLLADPEVKEYLSRLQR